MSAVPSINPAGRHAPSAPALGVDAAQALFERHSGRIYGYCLNRLGGREEAEDAVQSTFLNAFRALRRGVVPDHEAAWLYKIAENVCLERHRSRRRRLEVAQDPTTLEQQAAAPAHDGDELLGLDDALRRLAPRQREVLLLREWKGLSYNEIATELGLSPGAVETLIFRARRSLAQNLQSPQRLRSRLRVPGLQVGSLIAWLKSLLGGSAAVKVAAGLVVAASAALAGSAPADPPAHGRTPQPAARNAPTTERPVTNGSPALGQLPTRLTARPDASVPAPAAARERAPRPVGAAPMPGVPPTRQEESRPESPTAGTPATPVAPGPSPVTPSAPGTLPQPPVSLPVPPPPALPLPLPELPTLPQAPPLPPAPELPPVPEVPALPELPQLPQVPQLPKLP
ncbi:MAG TPA: sigma-70 family RNA polymerase sigma factor [Gaiellaceae bacterium]